MALSVVIPVRDDELALAELLGELQPLRGSEFELVVVEAESDSDSDSDWATAGPESGCDLSRQRSQLVELADQWLRCKPGRAAQLQMGALAARHQCLWFLHADTRDVAAAAAWLANYSACVTDADEPGRSNGWGRFDVQFDDHRPILRLVPWLMNWRSRLSAVCTGDQGIFVDRALLATVGGWPQQALMEDVELSKLLRRQIAPTLPARAQIHITTSARRWRTHGVWRTIFLMWWLRLRYSLGGDPAVLSRLYRDIRP